MIETEYGRAVASKVDEAVQLCAERERLYEGIYAQVYWAIFVNKISPYRVATMFKERLCYMEGMTRVKTSTHNKVTKGILDSEW